MIKAVIFDFGQVLVHFAPESILFEEFADNETRERLAPIVFSRKYWDRLDDGTLTEEEAFSEMEPLINEEYREGVRSALLNWYRRLPEWEGMRDILIWLKGRGIPVFVISNISRGFAEHAGEIPILSLTDGAVFSAEVGATKPAPEIFELACRKFGYIGEECVFIDDSPKNISGAKAFGLNTVLFDGNAESLRSELEKLLI